MARLAYFPRNKKILFKTAFFFHLILIYDLNKININQCLWGKCGLLFCYYTVFVVMGTHDFIPMAKVSGRQKAEIELHLSAQCSR